MSSYNVSITVEVDDSCNKSDAARKAVRTVAGIWRGLPPSTEVNVTVHTPGVSGFGQRFNLGELGFLPEGASLKKVIMGEIDTLCRQLSAGP